MSDGIMFVFGEDGVARKYDDTWDITIHCESEEEQKAVWEKLNNLNREVKNLTDTISRQPDPKWIPCNEKLPEDKTAFYLATVANRGLFFTTTLNNNVECVRWDYDRRKGQDSWHWCTERTVIAWMPLPEPYRGEGEKE